MNSQSRKNLWLSLSLLIVSVLSISSAKAEDAQSRSMKSIDIVQKPYMPNPVVRAAAQSILFLVQDMVPNRTEPFKVRVPSSNFVGVLQELQNRHAKFLFPGVEIPVDAKVVFQLEAEQAGLRQIVYFI